MLMFYYILLPLYLIVNIHTDIMYFHVYLKNNTCSHFDSFAPCGIQGRIKDFGKRGLGPGGGGALTF